MPSEINFRKEKWLVASIYKAPMLTRLFWKQLMIRSRLRSKTNKSKNSVTWSSLSDTEPGGKSE